MESPTGYITPSNNMAEQNIFQKAFDKALKFSGVTARHLAEKAKTSESNLSKFRLGTRDVYTETLTKYYLGLSIEGKRRFLEELLGEEVELKKPTLTELIEVMDTNNPADCKQAGDALRLIASRFFSPSPDRLEAETRESTDEARQPALLK